MRVNSWKTNWSSFGRMWTTAPKFNRTCPNFGNGLNCVSIKRSFTSQLKKSRDGEGVPPNEMKSSATSARALDCGNYLPLLEGMASFDDPSASGGKSGKELPQSK